MHKGTTLKTRLAAMWPSLVLPAALLLFWELGARTGFIDTLYFPAPSVIAARFIFLLREQPEFLQDVWHSARRFLIAAAVAVPAGVAGGVAMGLCLWLRRLLSPLISFTYPLPKLAIMPFLMMFFGIGDLSKIILIGVSVFYLVLLGVLHAVESLPRLYFDIIRLYRIGFWRRLWFVFLRGIWPDILNSCKVGLGAGVLMVLVSEFILARNGIGFFMWNAWDHFRIADIYVGFFCVAFAGLAIFTVFDRLVAGIKWRRDNAASGRSQTQP